MIEKIIHQIWLQGTENIPERFNDNIKSIKLHHPNWEYILWDEIKILELIRKNKEWTSAYYKFSYMHQRIDFAKYCILFEYGGVYIDMDAEALKSFDSLIDANPNSDFITSETNTNAFESYVSCGNETCYNNGIILAAKNNNVVKELINHSIEYLDCASLKSKLQCINDSTGPGMFSEVVHEYKDKKTLLLPHDYLEPCAYTSCNVTENSYTKHKHELSWMPEPIRIFLNFYVNNKIFTILLAIVIIVIIYKKIRMWQNNRFFNK